MGIVKTACDEWRFTIYHKVHTNILVPYLSYTKIGKTYLPEAKVQHRTQEMNVVSNHLQLSHPSSVSSFITFGQKDGDAEKKESQYAMQLHDQY